MHPPQNQNPGIPCHFRHFFVDQINMELYSLDKIHFQPLTPNPLQNQDRSRSKTEEWQHPKKQTGTAREFFLCFIHLQCVSLLFAISPLEFLSFLRHTKKSTKNKKMQTSCHLFLFLFCCVLVSCFLGSLFFLRSWQSKKNGGTYLCATSPPLAFANLFLVVCFGSVVSLQNHVKTMKNAGIIGASLGVLDMDQAMLSLI